MQENLSKKIAEDLKQSIKNKDTVRLSTIRMVVAAIKNLAIEKKTEVVDDGDVLKIIAKQVKQHHESIDSFKKGGREDLVEKEVKELEILKRFLPEQLSEEKIFEVIQRIVTETGASSNKDFGNVMKLSMEELKGRADGKIISSTVKKLLSG